MKHTNNDVLNAIHARSEGKLVYYPQSVDGRWVEGEGVAPLNEIPRFNLRRGDQYFSPLRFNGPRRRGAVGKPGVIFADIDNPTDSFPLPPSVLIVSSPGHGHGYWFLDEPVDPIEWEPHARGFSQELGADPGGWDLTQVLRVPGTPNHKYSPAHNVHVRLYEPGRIYKLGEFPAVTVHRSIAGDDPPPDRKKRDSYYERAVAIGTLPLSVRYWLTVTPEELKNLGKIDRSKIMWGVYKTLFEAGFTPDEIFQLTYFSAANKFRDHPGRLWGEINKAAIV